jgi:hypothetical protein
MEILPRRIAFLRAARRRLARNPLYRRAFGLARSMQKRTRNRRGHGANAPKS